MYASTHPGGASRKPMARAGMSPRGAESVSMSGGAMSMSAVPLSMSSGPLSMSSGPLSMSPRGLSMPASRASMRHRPGRGRAARQTAITAAVTIAVRRADDLRARLAPNRPRRAPARAACRRPRATTRETTRPRGARVCPAGAGPFRPGVGVRPGRTILTRLNLRAHLFELDSRIGQLETLLHVAFCRHAS